MEEAPKPPSLGATGVFRVATDVAATPQRGANWKSTPTGKQRSLAEGKSKVKSKVNPSFATEGRLRVGSIGFLPSTHLS